MFCFWALNQQAINSWVELKSLTSDETSEITSRFFVLFFPHLQQLLLTVWEQKRSGDVKDERCIWIRLYVILFFDMLKRLYCHSACKVKMVNIYTLLQPGTLIVLCLLAYSQYTPLSSNVEKLTLTYLAHITLTVRKGLKLWNRQLSVLLMYNFYKERLAAFKLYYNV